MGSKTSLLQGKIFAEGKSSVVECINCDAVVESKVNQSGKQILLMVFSDSAFMCYFVTVLF